MYLIDTNVLSELRRGSAPAAKWYASVGTDDIYLSVITLGEIHRGIVRKQSIDRSTAAKLNAWLQGLTRHYANRLLSIDEAVALEWGRITAGRSRNAGDGMIAATAIARNMTLVTRNVRDFVDLPIALLDPWAA